ncbi:OmpP1/FadL family transporter [Thalassovita taeanensis]|uniref:Long-chain fatty acid transport protein n=1 Tax=Thalassovita taeanensis TaxID=657014 RepID=A0A1H8Z8A9_9RHOB|nr:hypothetical protein [Thalassovita taeanensis]SEP60622.1 Long-chain fatty acid transport protein [Thalassovita taeanensis]
MERFLLGAAVAALSVSPAVAGGLDRSGQGIGILFEQGTVAELSFGAVSPSISGTYVGGAASSGNIGKDFTQVGLSFKQQVNDKLSLAMIMDQPFGASVDYTSAGTFTPLVGTTAELKSTALTALARYKLTDRFSVHGGIKGEWVEMDVTVPGGGALNYTGSGDRSFGAGYVVGAAYEIPDIALRVALTYSSEVSHDFKTTESSAYTGGATITSPDTRVNMPQSLNLDFQSGIAKDTLVFGSIRWADWTATNISPEHYSNTIGLGPLQSYSEDVYTYTLGIGRRFSDTWSGAVTLGHERSQGGTTGNLAPTDGYTSIGVGGSYTSGKTKISAGVRYVKIGNATSSGAGGNTGDFTDNDAWAFGVKLTQSF